MTESELIAGCREGKRASQRLLYDTHQAKMLGVCMRYFPDRDQAQDVLQDGFIKVFKNIVSFEEKGSFEGWIRRIMVNTALELIRKNAKKGQEVDFENEALMIASPESPIERLEANDILYFIKALPNGYRVIFNLFAIEGYSHQEIADQLNISVSTSYSQYHRARTLLQKILKNQNHSAA